MPSAGAADPSPDLTLAAEREHLRRSREFLELMRTDVLSLRALGGDPVSEEYLKADLYRRAEALRDLPDTPLFFGRLDYRPGALAAPDPTRRRSQPTCPTASISTSAAATCTTRDGTPVVIDWRAPVSRPFYRASQAEPMGLDRRRRFGFAGGELTAFEDEQFGNGTPCRRDQQDPDRRDRAAAVRPDARHRRHHPARPGRHRPGRSRADGVRAGRARHRQDRGRPAPGRLPAVRVRPAPEPRRRARHGPEQGLPRLHRATCCQRSASSAWRSCR